MYGLSVEPVAGMGAPKLGMAWLVGYCFFLLPGVLHEYAHNAVGGPFTWAPLPAMHHHCCLQHLLVHVHPSVFRRLSTRNSVPVHGIMNNTGMRRDAAVWSSGRLC